MHIYTDQVMYVRQRTLKDTIPIYIYTYIHTYIYIYTNMCCFNLRGHFPVSLELLEPRRRLPGDPPQAELRQKSGP